MTSCRHRWTSKPAFARLAQRRDKTRGDLLPLACHVMQQYANIAIEARSQAAEVPAAADAWPQTTPLGRVISAGRAFV